MNLKVAHLVSVQFGIFIGIVACLVFFRFEFARPRSAAEMRKPATERAAAVGRMSEPEDEPASMLDNRDDFDPAEQFAEQSVPAMPNEYSPEAVEKSRAILAKLYYEQIAPRHNLRSGPANSSIAAVAPSSTEVAQEPAAVQIDPVPQTVAYVQPTEVIVYPQPVQVVSFARPRRFVNGRRPALLPRPLAPNPHQQPDISAIHLRGLAESPLPGSPGLDQRRTTGVPACPPTQGLTPRRKP